jgi:hypothetical protein
MNQEKVVIKSYKGKKDRANAMFKKDAEKMAEKGYSPTAQSWAEGSWGFLAFLFALLLCVILIGILVFVYMLLVKPDGTLSVTYELRLDKTNSKAISGSEEKTCPQCAEQVKVAAKVCRYCGHKFESEPEAELEPEPEVDTWICVCGTVNLASVSNCKKCQKFKPKQSSW